MTFIMSNMTWDMELYFILKIALSFIAGGAIGWEREKAGKEAGIRTFGLICMGACSFSLIAELFSFDSTARIVANVVVGIGFIAGGVIYRAGYDDCPTPGKFSSHGLTTASSLWVTATVGVMVGLGMFISAIGVMTLTLVTLHLPSSKIWPRLSKKNSNRRR